ncbi:MAG: hypothetical protein IKK44_02480 [Clostridium sp.]|nr:hypothetical protein [Clostridium sp.]
MNRIYRGGIYALGTLTLAAGITLNTKTGLGVSPIISIPFSISELWGLDFAMLTFVLYALCIVGEVLIRRQIRISDLLQLPFSFVFSLLLDIFSALITYDCSQHGLGSNLGLLLLAVLLTGAGIALMVNMQLIPNPADGIVQAIAQRLDWEQGAAKNFFDISCAGTTCVLGLVFAQKIVGIGLGTLVAMVGVGRAVFLVNRLFKTKMCQAAGLA